MAIGERSLKRGKYMTHWRKRDLNAVELKTPPIVDPTPHVRKADDSINVLNTSVSKSGPPKEAN